MSEWAVYMGFGALGLVGTVRFDEVGARLSGVGGRNPPRMGSVSMGMCGWSGRGGVRCLCALYCGSMCVMGADMSADVWVACGVGRR